MKIEINEVTSATLITCSLFISGAIAIFGMASCQKESDIAYYKAKETILKVREGIVKEGVKKGIYNYNFDK